LFSTSETKAMLEEFRALVRAGVLKITPENEVLFVKEAAEKEAPAEPPPTSEEEIQQLDRQLMAWLARNRERRGSAPPRAPEPAEPPRAHVPDPRLGRLRQRVIERLADRILQRLESPEFERALREEVVDRVVEEMLRRWDRELK
jgi:hypothetical protein